MALCVLVGWLNLESCMVAQKAWYCYTDDSGITWRIQTTQDLAELGGLLPADESSQKPLPARIKPRYLWFKEWPRPDDRLPARQKVIVERHQLQYIAKVQRTWQIGARTMVYASYYGEVAQADGP
jgi:hypothetical protein